MEGESTSGPSEEVNGGKNGPWSDSVGKKVDQLVVYEAHIQNLSLLQCLEPLEKFPVGGWVLDKTVNIVFSYGPRLELSWPTGPS